MPVLDAAMRTHFEEHGYVVVPDAVPRSDLDALLEMIDACVGLAPHTWYRPPHHEGSFIEAYHQQALWNTRQRERVYRVFAELHDNPRQRVGVDRCSMKLPWRAEHPGYGDALPMHWDVHIVDGKVGLGLQGVLAITDTTTDMGGFACVPGSHRRLAEFQARPLINPTNPQFPGVKPGEVKSIAMNAGDLLVWHVGLLHGSLRNTSDRPRLAQYIKMGPATADESVRRRDAENFLAMRGFGFDKASERTIVPRRLPELSPLGRKLAGLDSW